MSPSRKREAVEHLEDSFEVSERRACVVLDQGRHSALGYQTPIQFAEVANS